MARTHPVIAIIGTLDTKLAEFLYLRTRILEINSELNVMLIDVGRTNTTHEAITISQSEVLAASQYDGDLESLPRGEVIKIMTRGATRLVKAKHQARMIHGIISLGGSGGTSIASAVMRELPLFTIPKLIVSTVASGDTSSYVAESDIMLMYSVVDIAGLNEMLKAVIDQAAAAIVGMTKAYTAKIWNSTPKEIEAETRKKSIGITMFGVTTPAVDRARAVLDEMGFEVYVFHATGAGGRAMERLISEGRLDGVLDLTTTELADELVGGVMSAGENRLTAAAAAGIPQIVSVGALDMVNFGPRATVPKDFQDRKLFEHNPSVTLMRTSQDECKELGRRLASRLRENCTKPEVTEVWMPNEGVSAISGKGQAFYDRAADVVLFRSIYHGLDGSGITVRELDHAINDETFAEAIAKKLAQLMSDNRET
ncbi:hypothetical protein F5Y18DRAFT_306960 [Xylariaceae sp. FL1019]|nr:hypothetical protein F5Y18DRAFT_306960 [Xylariaceae sp. FL1019]